jgi:hypothetical protein
MIQNVMHSIGGTSVYGVISICLFFAVFAGVLVWTLCLKQPYLNSMRELPLDGESAAHSEPEQPPNP